MRQSASATASNSFHGSSLSRPRTHAGSRPPPPPLLSLLPLLRAGAANAVGFRLGMCKYGYLGSFCDGAHGATAACRAAVLQLNVKFTDGTGQNVSTEAASGQWTGTTSANPVTYTHLFNGETFDARLEEPFDTPGFVPADLHNPDPRQVS